MTVQVSPSPRTFSALDGIAASATDVWLLIGRIALAWTFVAVSLKDQLDPTGLANYLVFLKVPASMSGVLSWLGMIAEALIAITLVFGVATRYGALLGLIFLIIATSLAHRYWELTGPQASTNFNYFVKNVSMMGGMIYAFVFGAGRFSVDAMLGRR